MYICPSTFSALEIWNIYASFPFFFGGGWWGGGNSYGFNICVLIFHEISFKLGNRAMIVSIVMGSLLISMAPDCCYS